MPHNVQKHHKPAWHKPEVHALHAVKPQGAGREHAPQHALGSADRATIKSAPTSPSLSETVEKARQALAQQAQAPVQVIDVPAPSYLEDKLQGIQKTVKELSFALQNPSAAMEIGTYVPGSSFIATNSARFASALRLPENEEMLGSHVNALRHALLQASITAEFGADMALKVEQAHELDPDALAAIADPKRVVLTGENALLKADELVDLLNDQIGRKLGAANPGASAKELAGKLLEQFKHEGLWVVHQTSSGYGLQQTTLTAKEYETARKALRHRNEDGFANG